MSVINVNRNNFQEEILNSEKIVLLDFWAPWCGPCRMVGPILDQIAQERPDVKVAKLNVDEEFELASPFRVVSSPTLMVVKNGEVVNRAVGARSKAQLLELL